MGDALEISYSVCCLDKAGSVACRYPARSLLYAKRYADLCREEYPVTQIRVTDGSGHESVYETFSWKKAKT